MRRVVLAAASSVLASASLAQSPETVPSWTGFYLGANAGVLQGDDGTIGASRGSTRSTSSRRRLREPLFVSNPFATIDGTGIGRPTALIGGGQLGYNQQMGAVVLGIETDVQTTSQSREDRTFAVYTGARISPVGALSTRQSYDYLGTVRGRIGYLVLPNLLVFATGGLAYGERNVSVSVEATGAASTPSISSARTGYVLGGGLEYALDQNWSVKGEGLYFDLGRSHGTSAVIDTGTVNRGVLGEVRTTSHDRGIIARVGLNYRFAGW